MLPTVSSVRMELVCELMLELCSRKIIITWCVNEDLEGGNHAVFQDVAVVWLEIPRISTINVQHEWCFC